MRVTSLPEPDLRKWGRLIRLAAFGLSLALSPLLAFVATAQMAGPARPVQDINVGIYDGAGGATEVNGILFFAADDGTHGVELWKSDETEAGTVLVKNINTEEATEDSMSAAPVVVGGRGFFNAADRLPGMELWVSDGTGSGTTLVKDIPRFGPPVAD